MSRITIYLAGSCRGDIGGWAATLLSGDKRKDLSDCEIPCTSQRIVLYAAISALRAVKRLDSAIEVRCSSNYLVTGASGQAVTKANLDLWDELRAEIVKHRVSFKSLPGFAYTSTGADCIERAQAEVEGDD